PIGEAERVVGRQHQQDARNPAQQIVQPTKIVHRPGRWKPDAYRRAIIAFCDRDLNPVVRIADDGRPPWGFRRLAISPIICGAAGGCRRGYATGPARLCSLLAPLPLRAPMSTTWPAAAAEALWPGDEMP